MVAGLAGRLVGWFDLVKRLIYSTFMIRPSLDIGVRLLMVGMLLLLLLIKVN